MFQRHTSYYGNIPNLYREIISLYLPHILVLEDAKFCIYGPPENVSVDPFPTNIVLMFP